MPYQKITYYQYTTDYYSQLDNKFAEASGNGVVLVNTGYSSNNTILFAFTANSTTTTFKVGALDDAAPALRNFSLIGSVVTPTDLGYELKYAADYYPYGKILREWQPATGPEKYLTTHHERDTETGLDYRGARYYDSDVARFLSLDPLATKYASWSDYNYVLDNPVVFIDPDGRDVKFSGAEARRSVRQARRRDPAFRQAFRMLRGDNDVFTFNRNQTQNPNIVNGAENSFDPNAVINGQADAFQIGKSNHGGTRAGRRDEVRIDFRDAPSEQIIMNGSNLPLIGTKKAKSTTTSNLFGSGTITLSGTSNEQVGDNGFDKVVITAAGQEEPIFEATLKSFQQGFPVSVTKGFNINKDNSNGFGNRSKLNISVQNDKAEKKNPDAFGITINIQGN